MIELLSPHGSGFPIVHVETEACTADVSLYGAQLLHWSPRGQKPVLWLSPQAVFRAGKAVRGGIPLCWPWFGPHGSDSSLPAHGVGRISHWTLESTTERGDGSVELRLTLTPENDELPKGQLDLVIGSSLSMRLYTVAKKDDTRYSSAFHTYFNVGDRERCTIAGLENAPFQEFAAEAVPHGEHPLCPLGAIDRVYFPCESEIWLDDPELTRRIHITREGSRSFVVWNPDDAAAGMADVGAGNERHFLCAEAAVTQQEGLVLRAGETHTLACTIDVLPLPSTEAPA